MRTEPALYACTGYGIIGKPIAPGPSFITDNSDIQMMISSDLEIRANHASLELAPHQAVWLSNV